MAFRCWNCGFAAGNCTSALPWAVVPERQQIFACPSLAVQFQIISLRWFCNNMVAFGWRTIFLFTECARTWSASAWFFQFLCFNGAGSLALGRNLLFFLLKQRRPWSADQPQTLCSMRRWNGGTFKAGKYSSQGSSPPLWHFTTSPFGWYIFYFLFFYYFFLWKVESFSELSWKERQTQP